MGLTCTIGSLLILSLLVAVGGDAILQDWSYGHGLYVAWRVIQWPFAFALLQLGFALTYNVAPDLKNRKWRWVTPGAIFGTFLLLAISAGVRIYLHLFGSFTATYGSLGAVIILLLCFYLSGVAVLAGGALNAVLENAGS